MGHPINGDRGDEPATEQTNPAGKMTQDSRSLADLQAGKGADMEKWHGEMACGNGLNNNFTGLAVKNRDIGYRIYNIE